MRRFLILALILSVPALSVAKPLYPQAFDAPPPALADADVVVANCSGCHSLDYITTQPRGMGAQFWRDAVGKMIRVYKAPIEPADVDAIATTLASRFG